MGQVEDDPPAGAPDWIVTFADMISLLVTFFILLLTFSSMEENEAFQVKGNIIGTTGVLQDTGGESATPPPIYDTMNAMDATRGAQLPHSRPTEELLDSVSDKGMKATEQHKEVNLSAMKDGILLKYDERACFKPGSVELSPFLQKSVAELARTLQHYPHIVVIEGHTDTGFQPTRKYATAEALCVAQCKAVAEVMLANSDLNPLQLQISAMGTAYPTSPNSNETADGRQRNRRVELRIMSNSEARAAALKQKDPSNG